jgi:hypothetical protein
MSDYDLINGEIINVTITVDEETVTGIINTAARGPAGADGSGTNSITSATTSDGTANLLLSNVTTATVTITGMSVAPTAVTTTSTTQLATTAFVQQELASGVAVAKNLEFLAHNGTGVTITKGSIVYINGAVSGNPRITLAQANNDTNSARTIGFAKADIANGANGFVISEGELENVRTADAGGIIGAGNQIYLSPTTPGAFTQTEPSAPNHLVYVGVITRASTGVNLDGRILVGIQNGYELNELHDVAISSPAAKQVIKRNAGNTLWVNGAIVIDDISNAGVTGAELFGAATAAAARTTLGFDAAVPKIPIVSSNSSDFPTASTGFVDVTGLSFPVAANKNYQVAFHLNTNKNDANGIQYRITGPASPTRVFGRAILFTSSTSTSTTDILTAFSSASTTFNTFSGDSLAFSSPSIIVSNGANAGTIKIQIRAVTGGTAKIYAGSWLQITEL